MPEQKDLLPISFETRERGCHGNAHTVISDAHKRLDARWQAWADFGDHRAKVGKPPVGTLTHLVNPGIGRLLFGIPNTLLGFLGIGSAPTV